MLRASRVYRLLLFLLLFPYTYLEHLAEGALHQRVDEAGGVGVVLSDLLAVHQPRAVHPLKRQHLGGEGAEVSLTGRQEGGLDRQGCVLFVYLARRELRVDPRDKDVRQAPVQLHEALGVSGLGGVVDLAVE